MSSSDLRRTVAVFDGTIRPASTFGEKAQCSDASGAYTMAVDAFGHLVSLTHPVHASPLTTTLMTAWAFWRYFKVRDHVFGEMKTNALGSVLEQLRYDAWSNIHYSHVGRSHGIPADILRAAADPIGGLQSQSNVSPPDSSRMVLMRDTTCARQPRHQVGRGGLGWPMVVE